MGGVFTGKIVAILAIAAIVTLVLEMVPRLTLLKLLGSLPWQLVLHRSCAV